MKRSVLVFVLLGSLLGAARAEEVKRTLVVPDMHCALCLPTVEKALRAVPGVRDVQVALPERRVTVLADEAVEPVRLVEALNKVGYRAQLEQGTR